MQKLSGYGDNDQEKNLGHDRCSQSKQQSLYSIHRVIYLKSIDDYTGNDQIENDFG